MITDMKDAKIFSPLQLGRTTLKNRIAMAPMSMHYEATNGTVPKQLADIFVRRAEGGAGYVVIDAVTVDHKYWYIGKTTALDKDSLVPQFAAFAKRVSDAGSTLFPQLIHPGPESICALKGITPLGPSVNTNANGAVSRRSPLTRSTRSSSSTARPRAAPKRPAAAALPCTSRTPICCRAHSSARCAISAWTSTAAASTTARA